MSRLLDLLAAAAGLCALALPAQAERLGLGRAALPEEISAWDRTVLPDGQGLRAGSGSVAIGEEVFAEKCSACHGDFGEGIDAWPVLAGGMDTLADARPVKTVGSYWPYLSTVHDYVNRSMPFGEAQTITTDEVYAITAYLLYSNGLVEDDFVLTHENFAEVQMPNAGGFYPDDRPEVEYPVFSAAPCMADCRATVEITKRASDIRVTPTDPDGRPAGTLPAIAAAPVATDAPVAVAAAAPEAPQDAADDAAIDPLLIAAGEAVFRKCSACHKVGEGAKSGVGPVLNGIVGHPAGAVEEFKYSEAMVQAVAGGLVWTPEALSAFIENPKTFLPKTKMAFAGLKKEEERLAVIAYLQSIAP